MALAKIYDGEYLGIKTLEFECGGYSGTFTIEGANLIRFDYDALGIKMMNNTEDEKTLRTSRVIGIPLLFFPNRIKNGTFTFEGKKYQFPINGENNNHCHGFLDGYTKWKVEKQEAKDDYVNITFSYIIDENDNIYKYFDFNIKILYENIITPEGLAQKITFENMSDKNMPFGFAYHTTFNIPFNNSPDEAFYVSANIQKAYELDKCIPTGNLFSLNEHEEKIASAEGGCVNECALDNVYLRNEDKNGKAVIIDKNTGIKVVYEADESFRHFILYNNDTKQKFLSIEPQTCCTNAVNSDDIPTANLMVIKPNERLSLATKIYIEK